MPHALVLLGFLAATVTLSLAAHMTIGSIVILLASSGGIGSAVLVAVSVSKGSGRRLLQRLLKAALSSGTGS
ncbi:hypothetical protein ACFXPZ_14085 [Streptomyces sp. NPDC059101]|uniref:hypothetical protein n=1 Tax=Streptomyces sp. NPDC059101 TaxID=3346728 RepID=UPI0036A570E4